MQIGTAYTEIYCAVCDKTTILLPMSQKEIIKYEICEECKDIE